MRILFDWLARGSATLILLTGVWVVLARDAPPQLSNMRIGGIDRSRYAELDSLPSQTPNGLLPYLEIVRQIRAKTPADAYFLVMWQNAFAYYAGRRFIRDVDPRMAPFYKATDKGAAVAEIKRLGIDYVFLPPWGWPTILHSMIRPIVEDPRLASLVADVAGYRVYHLTLAEAQ